MHVRGRGKGEEKGGLPDFGIFQATDLLFFLLCLLISTSRRELFGQGFITPPCVIEACQEGGSVNEIASIVVVVGGVVVVISLVRKRWRRSNGKSTRKARGVCPS